MAKVMTMPALSDTMQVGTIAAWHKKIGDKVKKGELLAEIESDKATMEVESPYAGTLLYIGVEKGGSTPVFAVLAVIGEEGENPQEAIQEFENKKAGGAKKTAATTSAKKESTVETVKATETVKEQEERLKVSPLARSIAKEEGIQLAHIKGTGDEGRIVKRDIEAYLKTADLETSEQKETEVRKTATAEGAYRDEPTSNMRKTIARRLGESKFTAPHFYLTIEIDMDAAKSLREELNLVASVKISFNDLVVKAVAHALKKHPKINASWFGDYIRYYDYVNIGVAVAVEEGLLVPVIRDAHTKSLTQLSTETREYAQKAKDKKLSPADMSGNTFTISNLGMFGIEEFTAIINPPDACILAVGGIAEKVVVKNGSMAISNRMRLTLSCDHRVVDGATAAQFLQTLKSLLEEPMRILL